MMTVYNKSITTITMIGCWTRIKSISLELAMRQIYLLSKYI